jgi:hypothetical protein
LVSGSIVQVLGQRMIPNKSAETSELISFLKEQDVLYGETNFFEVVSVDAGMTHLKNADFMHECGMIYLMGLKGNQPVLFKIAKKVTKNLKVQASSTDIHGGYEVVREIMVANVQGNFKKWPHMTEIWKVQDTKTPKHTKSLEK